jgi:alkylated DNA repair dioxygenase AlkB
MHPMTSLFSPAEVFEQLPIADAQVFYLPRLELGRSPASVLEELIRAVPWQSESVTLMGKQYPQPRLTAWYGDPGCSYTYSGLTLRPVPWSQTLLDLRNRVEKATAARFNSVLLNYYRDHRDSMGLHSDDEPELGPAPVIASLSLGEQRTFILRHRHGREQRPVRIELVSGSLLLMQGETQKYWRHGIDKQSRPCGPRVNLTFRRIIHPG